MTAATLTTTNSLDPDANGVNGSSYPASVSVGGTTLETTLFKQTIPANTFGDGSPWTDVAVRNYLLTSFGRLLNNSGAAKNLTLRAYANKTGDTPVKMLDTGAMSIPANASARMSKMELSVVVVAPGGPTLLAGLKYDHVLHGSAACATVIEVDDPVFSVDPGSWTVADDLEISVTAQWSSNVATLAITQLAPVETVG